MTDFGTLLCLIAYAPIDLPRVATSREEINEAQLTDKIPGWDNWLGDNSVSTRTNTSDEDTGVGRVSAHAFGVSNHFRNFRSVAGAEFRHRFLLRRDQIMGGEEYRFDVTHIMRGRFQHFAAVPWPDDPREPLAATVATVDWRIQALEVNAQGVAVSTLASSGQLLEHSQTVPPSQTLEDPVDEERRRGITFVPSGDRDVVCRVTTKALVAATGEFSEIRMRGIPPAGRFRMEVTDVQARRVLQEDDPCFDLIG